MRSESVLGVFEDLGVLDRISGIGECTVCVDLFGPQNVTARSLGHNRTTVLSGLKPLGLLSSLRPHYVEGTGLGLTCPSLQYIYPYVCFFCAYTIKAQLYMFLWPAWTPQWPGPTPPG